MKIYRENIETLWLWDGGWVYQCSKNQKKNTFVKQM